jgi:parallel beta-helix repeat protein
MLLFNVSGNVVSHNAIRQSLIGIQALRSDNDDLSKNTLANIGAIGIDVLGSADGVLEQNLILDSGALDGILIDDGSPGWLLERNIADGNGDDGIDVDVADATVTGNSASRNHDLGIEAEAGVTDGGGNKASGNGNPFQCTGVVCK